MFINKNRKSFIFNFIKKRKIYIKKLSYLIIVLNYFQNKFYQILHIFLFNNYLLKYQKKILISYIVYFCFSNSNTMLHIIDAVGNIKISYSAGLINLQGKQKIVRKLVLLKFFNLLSSIKFKFLKNHPISLYFKNVNISSKFLILKKLKKFFFIKSIKNFDLIAYNGCRKKKEKRKR